MSARAASMAAAMVELSFWASMIAPLAWYGPEQALGDYYIGTNHVLPTSGAGRFAGGLSVNTFTKRKMTVKVGAEFIREYGDNAERLARIEGLFSHGEAIKARKELI